MLTATLDWTYYLCLIALMLVGLFVNILGLPGLWLLVLAAGGYAWLTDFAHLGIWGLVALVLIGIVAEVVEFFAGGAGAAGAGGGKRSVVGAVLGALVGGILGTFIPIPIVGTLIGLCAGAFIGAAAFEHTRGKGHEHTLRVGVGAAKGRLLGTLAKTAIGLVMFGLAAFLAFPTGTRATTPATAPVLPTPTTAPTTAPATSPASTLPAATQAV